MAGGVLVGVDGSPGSRRALAWALVEAGFRHATVVAVTVWEDPDALPSDFGFPVDEAARAARAGERLRAAIGEVAGEDPTRIEPVVVEGDPAKVLCERAREADLLVVGSRGRGAVAGVLLGSVSAECAHRSPVPVVIVPAPHGQPGASDEWRSGRVVVGVDGSAGSLRALRWALEEASFRQAALQAVMVWRGVEADDETAFEFATFRSLAGYDRGAATLAGEHLRSLLSGDLGEAAGRVEPIVLEGHPVAALCEHAAGADLLVVGSRGHGALAELLLGSVSAACAHHSPCPLVIVPAARRRRAAPPASGAP